VANSSFALGMVGSIADKLTAMKTERDAVNNGTGRDLIVLKASAVDAELEKLGLKLRTVRRTARMVSPTAYEAGGAAGASLPINPGIRGGWSPRLNGATRQILQVRPVPTGSPSSNWAHLLRTLHNRLRLDLLAGGRASPANDKP
jgi:hypothetical protein